MKHDTARGVLTTYQGDKWCAFFLSFFFFTRVVYFRGVLYKTFRVIYAVVYGISFSGLLIQGQHRQA